MKVAAVCIVALNTLAAAASALQNRAAANVFTAEQVIVTLVDKAPFMVEVTKTTTWT
ncbi:hypothetical protein BJ165DRAFT_1518972 [Panaeolus papilionaceus]|nr:hypothetical protein BJ165DRAFT_1518972 [Panaeolus papilionaceus]